MSSCIWHEDGKLPNFDKAKMVFVFGSNMLGQHIGGAAKVAKEVYGAREGCWGGMTSPYSFGIATLGIDFEMVSLAFIKAQVKSLTSKVKEYEDEIFFITRVGCGIAGFSDCDIAPLFSEFVKFDNVSLPDTWKQILEK